MATKAKRALVPLAEGFEETEAVAVVDVLRRAGVEVTVAGLEAGPVTSAHGLAVGTDALLDDVAGEPFDAIVLPGGGPGTERLAASASVAEALRSAAERGAITAAICAAPTVLEKVGLLAGRRATCHASRRSDLGSARLVDEPVVVDGRIVTSQGAGTALAFGLALVSILVGEEEARAIAEAIHL